MTKIKTDGFMMCILFDLYIRVDCLASIRFSGGDNEICRPSDRRCSGGLLFSLCAGSPILELCRGHGISSATFYKWRSKFGGMDASLMAWIKPEIWRRIVVPESITLGNLHLVLQMAFNWGDCHLHEFEIGGERFGIPDPEFDWEPVRLEKRIQLKTALCGMTSFKYIYDFGDHWEHRIKVEKELLGDPELSHCALCLDGANAAPPEDVGGAPGYADFVFAIGDPNHPEHQQIREWYGDSFDPTHFDATALSLAFHNLKI